MSSRLIQSLAFALMAGAVLCAPASAADTDRSQSIHGYAVYLDVVPAEIVKGHATPHAEAPPHAEASMHGGVKAGSHHVMVSIIDEKTGKQVANATVEGRVGEIGLSVTTKKLEPMVIAGTTTYGNFFPIRGAGPFQIEIEFRPHGQGQAFSTRFSYTHPSFNSP